MYKPFFFLYAITLSLLSCKDPGLESPLASSPETPVAKLVEQDRTLTLDFITGRFDPSSNEDFILIPEKYTDRPSMLMHKEAFMAFEKMWAAAKEAGHTLIIRSAARNFDYQRGIWERKWTGSTQLNDGSFANEIEDEVKRALKILEYSSMPGTSRHHWGTDIDFNSFENGWFESGEGLALYNWLTQNAASFGFCRPYTAKDGLRPYGYNEEKWHWSYTPLASKYLSYAKEWLTNDDISGFLGSEQAATIDVVNKYVFGINSSCF